MGKRATPQCDRGDLYRIIFPILMLVRRYVRRSSITSSTTRESSLVKISRRDLRRELARSRQESSLERCDTSMRMPPTIREICACDGLC